MTTLCGAASDIKGFEMSRHLKIESGRNPMDAIIDCAAAGETEKLKKLSSEWIGSKLILHNALCAAACNGHVECVEFLCPITKPESNNLEALREAARNGHVECVKLLIPETDPKSYTSDALGNAAQNGHVECVKFLIPVSEPKYNSSEALALASGEGHLECVRLLIPVSEPKDGQSLALRWAAEEGHLDCVELLIPVSDVEAACLSLSWSGKESAASLISNLAQRIEMTKTHVDVECGNRKDSPIHRSI